MTYDEDAYREAWEKQIASAAQNAPAPAPVTPRRPIGSVLAVKCKRCQAEFIPGRGRGRSYCSDRCIELATLGRCEPFARCVHCGNELTRAQTKAHLTVCGDCISREAKSLALQKQISNPR